jgi:hypothetical protein
MVKNSPIGLFGGWGIRTHRRLGVAYTTDGNHGLFISQAGRKRTLLGIQNSAGLKEYLMKGGHLRDVDFDERVEVLK